jgi:16S rRNA (cytosine1402-N4)-methyltransferase
MQKVNNEAMQNAASEKEFHHVSIMLDQVIENLNIKPDGIYMDGTLGGAGHASAIARKLSSEGHLIGIDQDEAAISVSKKRLSGVQAQVTVVRDNYVNFKSVLEKLGISAVDGILLDLGVSSYQLDNAERGFSYMHDAPLDMRMDERAEKTAADIVNEYSERELFHVIKDFGEDRFAQNIAKHIVQARNKKRIETTFELNDIIRSSIPMKFQKMEGHPSKRTFQALRIELNGELRVLRDALSSMIGSLKPGGRIAIITFHSLEDRIVKNAFRTAENPCICPPQLPQCVCGRKSLGKVITRKPIIPSEEEMQENSRSRSAKLRVFERNDQKYNGLEIDFK